MNKQRVEPSLVSFKATVLLRLEQAKIPASNLTGCTVTELKLLKTVQNVDHLPEVYRDFMLLMGKKATDVFPWDFEWQFDYVTDMKSLAIERVEGMEDDLRLPSDTFVFLSRYQDDFSFFLTRDKNDDPLVYSYFGDGKFTDALNQPLSSFLLTFIDSMLKPPAM